MYDKKFCMFIDDKIPALHLTYRVSLKLQNIISPHKQTRKRFMK